MKWRRLIIHYITNGSGILQSGVSISDCDITCIHKYPTIYQVDQQLMEKRLSLVVVFLIGKLVKQIWRLVPAHIMNHHEGFLQLITHDSVTQKVPCFNTIAWLWPYHIVLDPVIKIFCVIEIAKIKDYFSILSLLLFAFQFECRGYKLW